MRRAPQLGFTQPGSGTATAVNYGAAAAETAVTGAAAAGWLSASAAGPIGAGIGLAALAITALIANSGCGPTCVLATGIVDQLEPQLRANRDAYLAGPRSQADYNAALDNFDRAFAWLRSREACGAPELNDAGRRCISDRDRGGQWDWFGYYRDPIVANQPVRGLQPWQFAGSAGSDTNIPAGLAIAAAAVLIGALLS